MFFLLTSVLLSNFVYCVTLQLANENKICKKGFRKSRVTKQSNKPELRMKSFPELLTVDILHFSFSRVTNSSWKSE